MTSMKLLLRYVGLIFRFIPAGIGGAAQDGAKLTTATEQSGAFDLSPDSHTQIRFMYQRNPPSLFGSFTVSADGYATIRLDGTANSHTFWRVKLGQISLQKR